MCPLAFQEDFPILAKYWKYDKINKTKPFLGPYRVQKILGSLVFSKPVRTLSFAHPRELSMLLHKLQVHFLFRTPLKLLSNSIPAIRLVFSRLPNSHWWAATSGMPDAMSSQNARSTKLFFSEIQNFEVAHEQFTYAKGEKMKNSPP